MFIPFKDLPGTSRVWIYQSSRFFEVDEIDQIKTLAYDFINDWTAHKQTLHASFDIINNLFLVLAVDENFNDASGCSIDKSVHFIKQIELFFNVDMFNRFLVAAKQGHDLKLINVRNITSELDLTNQNQISIYNNLVATKAELDNNWLQPINQSWVKNFLN